MKLFVASLHSENEPCPGRVYIFQTTKGLKTFHVKVLRSQPFPRQSFHLYMERLNGVMSMWHVVWASSVMTLNICESHSQMYTLQLRLITTTRFPFIT